MNEDEKKSTLEKVKKAIAEGDKKKAAKVKVNKDEKKLTLEKIKKVIAKDNKTKAAKKAIKAM